MPGDSITLAHGEGARLTRKLIREEILSTLGNPTLNSLADAATLAPREGSLVFTTDAHVVSPLFFPGGDIGLLGVHGAINDLAVSGADPAHLALALVVEEGFPLADLRRILQSIALGCRESAIQVVTGDTKVVPRGTIDGLILTVSGVGYLRPERKLAPESIQPGDVLLVNGTLGDHGIAVLQAREKLFEGDTLPSDTAPLHGLISTLPTDGSVLFLRDATRGGVAAVLHELVEDRPFGIRVEESAVPVSPAVRGACELLGLDPLHVANEGKLLAVVRHSAADACLQAMRQHPLGRQAERIGQITDEAGRVLVRGLFGQVRPLLDPAGAPLPRIC